ncbi:MAG: hypothetical protein DME70_07790 [Verrucomicrobia bacterium]|nr:MAG: hypothetical protein DME70_07790 [Verrucomicrobiota bacterium]
MNMTEFDRQVVDKELHRHGYFILKDKDLESRCEAARKDYEISLARAKLHAPGEKFDYKKLSRKPWRKLAIGSKNGLGHSIAQNLQTTYFSPDDRNYPGLGVLFRSMVAVRNKLMAVDLDFGSNPKRDGFWNACRIHHYPRGGGFMSVHRDTYFRKKLADKNKPFYQMLVLLSQKKVDFFTGGGVLVDFDDKKIDVETEGGFGSMILYDGRTKHGVEDIDLDQVIDFSRSDGRIVALTNLYCTL